MQKEGDCDLVIDIANRLIRVDALGDHLSTQLDL